MIYGNLTMIVVDDHSLYSLGLKEFLGHSFPGSDIRTFKDYDSVQVAINEAIPSIIYIAILDGNIGNRKGFELIKPLKEAFPNIYIISHSGDDKLNNAALEEGADIICSKGIEEENMVLIIKKVYNEKSNTQ